jgi:hypothetical protein
MMMGGIGGNVRDLVQYGWTVAAGGQRSLLLLLLLFLLCHHATHRQHKDASSDDGHYVMVVHWDHDGQGDRVKANALFNQGIAKLGH